jgi:hypothetical protein
VSALDPERFALFFSQASIPAKEGGGEAASAGEVVRRLELNPPQVYVLNQICEGLAEGAHIFWILKARQQGVTTEALLLLAYWAMIHDGMIFGHIAPDTELKEVNRALLAGMLRGIPKEWKIGSPINNRTMMEFDNSSRIIWLNANAKKGKPSGLGQGIGMLGLHGTEVGSWTDADGIKSLMSSLAQKNPVRLYLFEGTSKGAGPFRDYWMDSATKGQTGRSSSKAIFTSWWMNPYYQFDLADRRDCKLHDYWWGRGHMTREEEGWATEIKKRYNYEIKPEQVSWYRWMDGDKDNYKGRHEMLLQEYPHLPEDAWTYGAKNYVRPVQVNLNLKRAKVRQQEHAVQAFRYEIGPDFENSRFVPCYYEKGAYDLLVFEPPTQNVNKSIERLVISCDPTHGVNEESDLGVITVWRAHTDRLVQLAEYVRTDAPSYHLVWVILELIGLYDAYAKVIIELQGGGYAMHDHMEQIQSWITTGYNESLAGYFEKMDFYRYQRPDSSSRKGSQTYQWVTSLKLKGLMLERLRDYFETDQLEIRSIDLIREIADATRAKDGEIKPAEEDNRLMAAGLAVMGWGQVIKDDIRDDARYSYAKWLEACGKVLADGQEEELPPAEAHFRNRIEAWKNNVRGQISAKEARLKDIAEGNYDQYVDEWEDQEGFDSVDEQWEE